GQSINNRLSTLKISKIVPLTQQFPIERRILDSSFRVYEHIPLLRGVVPIVEERDKRKRGVLNLRKKTRFSLISSSEELKRTQV
ncbi:MAG: hypothetical protein KAW12_01250, partial [Candidatus Aminicenantes bacterium]|nr:hypothetical protein [Candidatus Aminicenantes bacterium]